MPEALAWSLVLRSAVAAKRPDVPRSLLTVGPAFRQEAMPDEVAILLPTNDGPRPLIDRLTARPPLPPGNAGIGLFLADPFLDLDQAAERLRAAGYRWVANLPSVVQQDEDFGCQLTDVGLGSAREYAALAQLRNADLRIAAVVSDAATAEAALVAAPEILLVMPRVGDFAAGFPSLRQRGSAAQEVLAARQAAGHDALLLGLGQAEEAGRESQWPPVLDGLLCRPQPCGLKRPLPDSLGAIR